MIFTWSERNSYHNTKDKRTYLVKGYFLWVLLSKNARIIPILQSRNFNLDGDWITKKLALSFALHVKKNLSWTSYCHSLQTENGNILFTRKNYDVHYAQLPQSFSGNEVGQFSWREGTLIVELFSWNLFLEWKIDK